ncbi:sodium-dependent organic anion transporter-like [Oppia nitens]|uniref:sodium-dependent organic anion transporter-like n=1 Tax=Oppia nitens TaxID=1686743 RepID=UPI0023DCB944|nr:sodium-dependent organic anion transporter-like [Oppia nitens]
MFENNSDLVNVINFTDISDTSLINSPTKLLIKQIHDVLIVFLLIIIMFAMGCTVTLKQIVKHLMKPLPLFAGLVSQFIIYPLIAFLLIKFLSIEPLYATGLLILATCPGGVLSNVFTYFWEGDIPLSITMTTMATIVGLVAMPLNIWLYGQSLETESLVIPYKQMSLTLLFITIPVLIGIAVNYKFPKASPLITKIGSIAGFAVIIVCHTLEVIIFPNIFKNIPLEVLVTDALLPIIGLSVGYLTASLLCLSYKIKKTIAIEIGIKNLGTALTIITLSFPLKYLQKTILFPILYTFFTFATLITFTIVIKIGEKYYQKSSNNRIINNNESKRLSAAKCLLQRDITSISFIKEDN